MEREDGTGASTSPAPDEPDASFEFVPAPTVAALDACRYARWHAIPELAKHAYGSVTVRLPPEYVQYLLEDGVHSPRTRRRCRRASRLSWTSG